MRSPLSLLPAQHGPLTDRTPPAVVSPDPQREREQATAFSEPHIFPPGHCSLDSEYVCVSLLALIN